MKRLTAYQMVVARGELIARLPVNRKFRDDAPGSARALCDGHVEAMEQVIEVLNEALVEIGVAREEAV